MGFNSAFKELSGCVLSTITKASKKMQPYRLVYYS